MGPQSVVYTWSEFDLAGNDRDDEADDEAEAMVLHPELVVYPYVEPSPASSEDEDEKIDHGLRRRRKTKKPTPKLLFETRTIVVGAMIVLGVSIAVYGLRAKHGGGAGTRTHWKKVGGVLIGARERIAKGLGFSST